MKNPAKYIFRTSVFLMGLYWFGNAFILTYASIFLLDRGLTNTEIGVVLSGGALLSILLQGIPSSLADRFPKVSLKFVMSCMLGLELLLIGAIIAFPQYKLVLICAYALLEGVDWAFLAFVNATAMEYENYGFHTNFSVVRSAGSIFYGVATLLLGIASHRYGLSFLMPCLFLVRVITLFNVSLLFNPRTSNASTKPISANTNRGYKDFFNDHPQLPFLLFGFFCLWMSGTSTNNFIIHIIHKVGGNNADMGFISSTSAWLEVPFMLLCGYLLKSHSCNTLLRISAFFYITKPIVMLLAQNITTVALGQYLQGPSYALFTITSVYYLNQIVSPKDSAKAQAILGISTKGMSGIVANLTSGIILDNLGIDGMLFFCLFCTIIGFCMIMRFTALHKEITLENCLTEK